MMARTQITLEPELHRKARKRAGDLRVSLAQYLRQLVAEDLKARKSSVNPAIVFDLGKSNGSHIARDKDAMLAAAFAAAKSGRRR